ncbi:MAG: Abi family protein [Eubacteriales bacterium]
MEPSSKPILTVSEQIDFLVNKGVSFNHLTRLKSIEYLTKNNNYFRLTAFRKNFIKIQNGDDAGKYQGLDFSYLVDLAIIDTRMRTLIMEMSLNIEHFAKVKLLKAITEKGEDGYLVVEDFLNSMPLEFRNKLMNEINRNRSSCYCCDIVNKYSGCFPAWAFVEIITFGSFVNFYKFCADRFDDEEMKDDFYLFLQVKCIRNASAHNNCIINDLLSKNASHSTRYGVSAALGKIANISEQIRDTKMGNPRIQQFVTLLYAHKKIVLSEGVHKHIASKLQEITKRMFRDYSYSESETVETTFIYIKNVVDSWFN